MKNTDVDIIHRNCIDEAKGDCPYVFRNEYGTACCSIDGIVQVEFYACTPHEVLLRMSKMEE